MQPSTAAIFHPKLRAYHIWGTHQGVGKSVASIIFMLSIATVGRGPKGAKYNIAYQKPVDFDPDPDPDKVTLAIMRSKISQGSLPKPFAIRKPWYSNKESSEVGISTSPLCLHMSDTLTLVHSSLRPACWNTYKTMHICKPTTCQVIVVYRLPDPGYS